MSTTLRTLALAVVLAASGALVVACTGDDSDTDNPGLDAGVDGHADTGTNPGTDGSVDGVAPGTDGGDGGDGGTVDFSVFVKDLIDNHTNGKDPPAAIPADNAFTDNQDQADYPATYFQ